MSQFGLSYSTNKHLETAYRSARHESELKIHSFTQYPELRSPWLSTGLHVCVVVFVVMSTKPGPIGGVLGNHQRWLYMVLGQQCVLSMGQGSHTNTHGLPVLQCTELTWTVFLG